MAKNVGLWANIHAKRKRIKGGSGETKAQPGDKNYPAGNLGQISAGTGDEELVSGESTGDFQLK